jgi:agmatine deiminase
MPRNSEPRRILATPLSLGFRFPAEWEPHAATWFSWPRPEGISFPAKHHTVPENLARIIREIAPRELVHINVPNANWQRIVTQQLLAAGVPKRFLQALPHDDGTDPKPRDLLRARIRFHFIPTNESWCRDHGPAFLVGPASFVGPASRRATRTPSSQRLAIVDWGFNAWGGKYPPFDSDDAVPTRIAVRIMGPYGKTIADPRKFAGLFEPTHPRAAGEKITSNGKPTRRVVMEGGAVEFNGAGTILTTEHCLLNKNRNPRMKKADIEQSLKDNYGARHVVWLGEGIVGDDTDGHIDDLARFIGPRTIVTTIEEDPRDANFKLLKDNLRRLQLARDPQGKPFDIVTIPMPGVVEHAGQRLPATYANFYFVNGALLLPTYRHRKSEQATIDTLTRALKAAGTPRQVVPIDCTELIWGLGAIHCLTQQQPALGGPGVPA